MCDVPCASDAAIRKIPKKWSFWNPKSSHELHPLQFKIVERGLQLLKVGGKLSYSTCSLNPIENEAVVAQVLKKYASSVRILKVPTLDGFKFTPGLKKWHLMPLSLKQKEPAFTEYHSLTEVPEAVREKEKLTESMFASFYRESILEQLSDCIRVMPHHHNTSGFFITIFEKFADFEYELPDMEEAKHYQHQFTI